MRRRDVLAATFATLAGCADRLGGGETTTRRRWPTDLTPSAVGYPLGPGGNPVTARGVRLADATARTHATADPVEWVVGLPNAPVVAYVTSGGTVGAVGPDGTREIRPPSREGPPAVAPGSPPRLLAGGSPLTHAAAVPGGVAFVTRDGTLRLRGETTADLAVDALPDARPVYAAGRLWLVTGRSRAYRHGILGDELEGERVTVVDPRAGTVREHRPAPDGTVIEGLAPLVVAADGANAGSLGGDSANGEATDADGTAADSDSPAAAATALVTVSDGDRGARLAALGETPRVGPAIGSGFRWRHQLAVAPFGPDGRREAVAVRTPHIGGSVEFFRFASLDRVAARPGYSTHEIGSRRLGTAVAGPFTADDRPAVVLPTEATDELAALVRVRADDSGVAERTRVSLNAPLTGTVTTADGGRVLAAGTADGVRLWTD